MLTAAIWILLCAYGFTMIPLAYLCAYMFDKPGTGFAMMLGVVSMSGGILVSIMTIIDFIGEFVELLVQL